MKRHGYVKSFCYLGDTLDGNGGADLAVTLKEQIWMCGICMKDRRTSEELRRLVGVEHITTVIRSSRLRWYVHVMRTW